MTSSRVSRYELILDDEAATPDGSGGLDLSERLPDREGFAYGQFAGRFSEKLYIPETDWQGIIGARAGPEPAERLHPTQATGTTEPRKHKLLLGKCSGSLPGADPDAAEPATGPAQPCIRGGTNQAIRQSWRLGTRCHPMAGRPGSGSGWQLAG